MSIILGPYDGCEEETPEKTMDKELLVFGYACKLYRDEAKSIMENSGQLLIPWMGNSSLMVDRYDVRNKLDDQSQFGLKPSIPRPLTTKEMDFEEELDRERYLALECDEIRVEEEEEMEKRKHENAFTAIGYSYNTAQTSSHKPQNHNLKVPFDGAPFYMTLRHVEHPSTATVDCGSEKDKFVPCGGLVLPSGMQLPTTNKLHSIIEKTASFINKQGTQMEIIIKTRQKFNPFFSFLNHDDVLYPYFKHMKEIISTGSYVVQEKKGLEQRKGDSVDDRRESASNHKETRQQKNLTEIDTKIVSSKASVAEVEPKINTVPPGSNSDNKAESDSDDDEYLHPLLLSSSLPGKTQTTSIETPITTSSSSLSSSTSSNVLSSNKCASRTDASSNGKKLTMNEILNLHSTSASFVARSRAVNSAPSTEGEVTQAYETASDADPEAVAAYEFYRQQYYDSSNNASAPALGNEEAYSHVPFVDIPSLPVSPGDGYDHQQQQYPPSNGHYPPSPYEHYPPAHGPPPSSYDQYPSAYYYHKPEGIPPPDIRPIVDKTAEYVAKNCESFERTVLDRHLSDPRFSFLNPWDCYHAYYEAMKQYNRSMLEAVVEGMTTEVEETEEVLQRPNMQKLNSSGAVSFKLQPSKTSSSTSLQAPPSGFEEVYSDGEDSEHVDGVVDEKEEVISECDADNQEHPPTKKQRIDNDNDDDDNNDDDDEIGNTVQAFLSTVKDLFT